MGILKTPKEFRECPTFTDPNQTTETFLTEESDIESTISVTNANQNSETNSLVNQQINNHKQRSNKRYRNGKAPKAAYFSKFDGKRVRGSRQSRRHENMCFLLSLVEETELDLDEEIKYEDIVRPQMSAFAKVMSESKSLQIWTDFISRSGQEQDEIIEFADKINKENNKKHDHSILEDFVEYYHEKKRSKDKKKSKNDSHSDDDFEMLNDYLSEKCVNLDKRLMRSEFLYKKIDKNIRKIMKRPVAVDAVANYEETLVSTFSTSPDTVYISKLPSSFDRMIMHGVCQYLDLNSKSFDRDGHRHTQVENNRNVFKMPSLLLSEFIKLKFSNEL